MTIPILALLFLIWLLSFVLLWAIPYPTREDIVERIDDTGSVGEIFVFLDADTSIEAGDLQKILIPIICWVAGGFVVAFWLLILLITSNLQAAAPWTVLHVLCILQIYWILFRMGNYGFYTAFLYPLPFVFLQPCFPYPCFEPSSCTR